MRKLYKREYSFEAEQVEHWSTFPGVCTRITADYNTGRILHREAVIDVSTDGSGIFRVIRTGDWVLTSTDGSTNERRVVSDGDFRHLYKEAK